MTDDPYSSLVPRGLDLLTGALALAALASLLSSATTWLAVFAVLALTAQVCRSLAVGPIDGEGERDGGGEL